MAIEDILKALDDQAHSECDQILAEADAEAKAIVDEAKVQAERIRTQRMDRVKQVAEPKAQQLVNAARLSNRRELESARMQAVDSVFEDAKQRLVALKQDPGRYEPVMRSLLKEASVNSNGDSAVLIDPADEELVRRLMTDMALTCSVQTVATPYGGVTLTSHEGKIARRNTLDDRLELVRSSSRAAVAEMLFG